MSTPNSPLGVRRVALICGICMYLDGWIESRLGWLVYIHPSIDRRPFPSPEKMLDELNGRTDLVHALAGLLGAHLHLHVLFEGHHHALLLRLSLFVCVGGGVGCKSVAACKKKTNG